MNEFDGADFPRRFLLRDTRRANEQLGLTRHHQTQLSIGDGVL
jgi:hypothetical protein